MKSPLPAEALRWRLDPTSFAFHTTDEVDPVPGVVGQSSAVEALRFGLECNAPGQNVFIRGLTGTGRMTLVSRLLEELKPVCDVKFDRCYVHNFKQPECPRLITLPAGKGRTFRRRVHDFAEYIRDGLRETVNAEAIKARRESLERRTNTEVEKLTGPFEKDLKENDLALVSIQMGPVNQPAIFPVVDGKPVPPEEFEQLEGQGQVTEERVQKYRDDVKTFGKRLEELSEKVRGLRRKGMQAVHAIIEETVRAALGEMAREILAEFGGDDVRRFLSETIDDVADTRITGNPENLADPMDLYGVNLLHEHEPNGECPIVIEGTPTLANLLGTVDREWTARGPSAADYRNIRAGSLLRADGGYLILDVRDVLTEPGAWKVLMRTLRNSKLEIVPPELVSPFFAMTLKPEPIPVKLKVVLLGESDLYYMLDNYDPDFGHLFKVLADFDTVIERSEEGVRHYAGVLTRIIKEEELLPFDSGAVAELVEHGARVAARRGKLTARFARIADIAREASFLAAKRPGGPRLVRGADVVEAIRRGRRRADLPSRKFREYLADGTIRVQTRGGVVGQINGLAVISAGPLTYGFPARITASIGAGSAGLINIEGQAQLSGSLHTKGFHILGGLLRHLLKAEHPLAFSASLAFEQSYGTIDGDSASGAEICCLLSALCDVPIHQHLAMTGSIDQVGHIQAIGGVNEKIEGFFDVCNDIGLTGEQGVIIPTANAGDLMLRPDVVEACRNGHFQVYAVETVHEALELLTGQPAGRMQEDGTYPADTLLRTAQIKAEEYWVMASQTPVFEPE